MKLSAIYREKKTEKDRFGRAEVDGERGDGRRPGWYCERKKKKVTRERR